ncbi:MAG: ROK family protein [Gaiellaceae bacterium]
MDVQRASPTWGRITTTPKPGWATDVVAALRRSLDLPLAFDTDVNAAALDEHRWGAAAGLETFCYTTSARHRWRRHGERAADARAAPSRVRAHAGPARPRPRPIRGRRPQPRRLLRGARLG